MKKGHRFYGHGIPRVNSEDLGGTPDFFRAAASQWAAGITPMPDVTVGHREQFHLMAFGRPHRRDPARLQFAIVRVGTEANDAQLTIVNGLSCQSMHNRG